MPATGSQLLVDDAAWALFGNGVFPVNPKDLSVVKRAQLTSAVAVALAESGGKNEINKWGSNDPAHWTIGPWQMDIANARRDLNEPGLSPEQLNMTGTNALAMAARYRKNGNTWAAYWSTGRPGANRYYRKAQFYGPARRLVNVWVKNPPKHDTTATVGLPQIGHVIGGVAHSIASPFEAIGDFLGKIPAYLKVGVGAFGLMGGLLVVLWAMGFGKAAGAIPKPIRLTVTKGAKALVSAGVPTRALEAKAERRNTSLVQQQEGGARAVKSPVARRVARREVARERLAGQLRTRSTIAKTEASTGMSENEYQEMRRDQARERMNRFLESKGKKPRRLSAA